MKGVADATLFKLIHDFFKIYLPNHKKCSAHTVRAYRTALDSLLEFIKTERKIRLSEITFKMIDRKIVVAFLDKLEIDNGCSASTRNHRLYCIRSFFAYAAEIEPTTVIYLDELRKVPIAKTTESAVIEYMSEAAVAALLEQPDTKTRKGRRDHFLMLLIYDTAARIQELLDIKLRDIRLGSASTVILHGKGAKVRSVPLSEKAAEHLQRYIQVFHPCEHIYSEQYLFYVDRLGKKSRMTEDNVRRLMRSYGISANAVCPEVPQNVHPHLWRHSRAMHLYQNGMDLTLISQWLGHSKLETSLIYAHADTELKRKAIEKSTSASNPMSGHLDSERYIVDDEETLKYLCGLK